MAVGGAPTLWSTNGKGTRAYQPLQPPRPCDCNLHGAQTGGKKYNSGRKGAKQTTEPCRSSVLAYRQAVISQVYKIGNETFRCLRYLGLLTFDLSYGFMTFSTVPSTKANTPNTNAHALRSDARECHYRISCLEL